jgi:hypothetical protein
MSKHAQRKGRTPSRKIRRLILTGIIVAALALGTMAAVSLRTSQSKATSQSSSAQINNARTDFRAGTAAPLDPQTGQIRPLTPEEAQRLAAGIKQVVNQSTEGLQYVRHADGSISVDLQGRFQNAAVAKLDEDGKLTESCVDNPEAAAEFFGIDPQLVGVKRSASATKTSNATVKGETR